MSPDVLSARALGRATLARQLLLERATMPVLDAVRHLVGMQAQIPLNPYLGLWSRLEGFQPEELGTTAASSPPGGCSASATRRRSWSIT